MLVLNTSKSDINKASEDLLLFHLVAFPTETVYGVGCVYNSIDAFNRLNMLKGERGDKPYTLMCADVKEIKKYAVISDKDFRFLKKFMPGSLTVLLKAKDDLPTHVSKDGVVGIRIPSNAVALTLLKKVHVPLLVPSLNRSGKPPMNDVKAIMKEFDSELGALIVDKVKEDKPSTIISLINNEIKIIREGKIDKNILIEEYQKL